MLYVSTRGNQDAFTAYRAIRQERSPEGGFFVPMRMPMFTQTDILRMSKKSFGQNVSDILNLFFGTKFTCWDVDVSIGRRVFTAKSVGHRTVMGQLWQDAHGNFDSVLLSLAELVYPELTADGVIPNWLEIGIRISVIFGIFGDLLQSGQVSCDKGLDIAVCTGSFAMPMALWYARQMGLPIRTLVFGCNENGAVWDLLHRGSVDTGLLSVKTTTPEADFALPPNLERLIHGCLGAEEALRYWWSCTEGKTYELTETDIAKLNKGTFAAVVSKDRIATIIPSVYRTNRYILDPYGALAYGALSDYRARTGSIGTALVLLEKNPVCEGSSAATYLNISSEKLAHMLSES